jgi:hypothetical protein
MNQSDKGRLAFAIILGSVGALAITKSLIYA